MNREEMMSRILDRTEPWDMLVVGGGDEGGRIVAYGPPEAIMAAKGSHTGKFLKRRMRSGRSSSHPRAR